MENGFDDFDTQVQSEEVYEEDAEMAYENDYLYEDFQSQYDDDPSPYGGTYSEE